MWGTQNLHDTSKANSSAPQDADRVRNDTAFLMSVSVVALVGGGFFGVEAFEVGVAVEHVEVSIVTGPPRVSEA